MKRLAPLLIVCGCIVGDRPAADNLVCAGGSCQCAPSFGNCDGRADNGCEARLDLDADNCGACGSACVNGTCEAGACACNDGFVDCNAVATDGCEAQLAIDAAHCGECDHGCLLGACSGARCQPYLVSDLGGFVDGLAVDEEHVYFCDGDTGVIYRVDKRSRELGSVAYDQQCEWLGVAGEQLFWLERSASEMLVRTAPAAGGDFTTVDHIAGAYVLTTAGGRAVYSVSYDDDTTDLWSVDAAGDTVLLALGTGVIYRLAPAGDEVVYVDTDANGDGGIYRVAAAGGTPELVAPVSGPGVGALTAVDGSVFWSQSNLEGTEFYIFQAPLAGGAAVQVFTNMREYSDLLGDGASLYWTENFGDRMVRADVATSQVEVLVEYQSISLPQVSDDALYWVDFPGHLFALAK